MTDFDAFIKKLFELGPIKTWSLIVTAFGDREGHELSGKELRALMEPLGVKPEATRVALHRLKKDGWIVSQRSGREVIYRLSKSARDDTQAVYDNVYQRNVKYPEGWQFLLLEDTQYEIEKTMPLIGITRQLVLVPKGVLVDTPASMEIQIVRDKIPIWFQNRLLSNEMLELAQRLSDYIVIYQQSADHPSSEQKSLIRLLILHHWRRLALRAPTWAHIALLPNGPVANLQKNATEFLEQTPPAGLS